MREDVPGTADGELEWSARYPSQAQLRREIEAMAASFLDALLTGFPAGTIAAVWQKGSSLKQWDSPIDYVPELSDVDMHVQFAHDVPDGQRYFGDLENALAMRHRMVEEYRGRISQPIHVPRVQMVVANVLHRLPDFVPTPLHTSHTVFGEMAPPTEVDPVRSRAASLEHLLEHEQYVRDLPENVVDKADRHLWPVLRTMTWRVAPTGPRVLEVLGAPYEDAWGINRTHVSRALRARGEDALAEHYTRFYLEGWQYFLSGYGDGAAAHNAILAGARVLEAGAAIARRVGPTLREI